VLLWIASGDIKLLPPEVLALDRNGLKIIECGDLRSYKKLVPALVQFPDSYLVTADDDLYYPADWLESLLADFADPNDLVCHRAHRIVCKSSNLQPYAAWQYEYAVPGRDRMLFPTTGAGVLFPPQRLGAEAVDVGLITELCPTADDVWFFWMARMAGLTPKKSEYRFRLKEWRGTQENGLYTINAAGGMNDVQIGRMVSRFGKPCKST
jgi:hypothetical protein